MPVKENKKMVDMNKYIFENTVVYKNSKQDRTNSMREVLINNVIKEESIVEFC